MFYIEMYASPSRHPQRTMGQGLGDAHILISIIVPAPHCMQSKCYIKMAPKTAKAIQDFHRSDCEKVYTGDKPKGILK